MLYLSACTLPLQPRIQCIAFPLAATLSCSFEAQGLYMNGPALFGSGLLLLLLLALSFERILGLDRVINKALQ
jgi:hypothetical protein